MKNKKQKNKKEILCNGLFIVGSTLSLTACSNGCFNPEENIGVAMYGAVMPNEYNEIITPELKDENSLENQIEIILMYGVPSDPEDDIEEPEIEFPEDIPVDMYGVVPDIDDDNSDLKDKIENDIIINMYGSRPEN